MQGMPKITLLIIEDCVEDRLLYRRLLKKNFADISQIIEVNSSEEAFLVMEDSLPSCCLVDYNLPGKSGLEFIRALRKGFSKTVPVIAITGQGSEAIAVEMMKNGAQDYIVKNQVTPERLYLAIQSAIHTCQLQQQLYYLAHYDSLTGLLNRTLFMDRLQQTMNQCQGYNQSCALLYIDIDDFKRINDHFGHEMGDHILKQTSEILLDNCRATDSVARLGGDEFVVLLERITSPFSHTIAEKIIQAFNVPFRLGIHAIQVTVSIGVAHYPATVSNPAQLLKQADDMLYQAKRRGRAQYAKLSSPEKKSWERRVAFEQGLASALQQGDLHLAFQPIVSTQSPCFTYFEVLSRWPDAHDDISVLELIGLVERLGLLQPFYFWLFNTTFKQLAAWQKQSRQLLRVCLNLSSACYHNPVILSYLREALLLYHLSPEQVDLEISESTLMKNAGSGLSALHLLKEEGFSIVIDDFGIGYSSMVHLTKLPVTALKVGRQFFADMEKEPRNIKIAESIASLAKGLGLHLIAKGVETLYQLKIAEKLGYDYIQGFWVGTPQFACEHFDEFIGQYPSKGIQSLSVLPSKIETTKSAALETAEIEAIEL